MGFNDFFEREDVYNVIENTLSNFYKEEFKFKKRNENLAKKYAFKFYSFSRINTIFSSNVNKRELRVFLLRNFIGNQGIFIRIIKSLYIFSCLYFPFLFTRITMFTDSKLIDKKLIYPGNKRIKVVDFEKKSILNIMKIGFKNEWFWNDYNIRKSLKYSWINPVLKTNDLAYSENLLEGTTLARVNESIRKQSIDKIFDLMCEFHKDETEVSIVSYITKIILGIEDNIIIKRNNFLLLSTLRLIKSYFSEKHYKIKVSYTHGDLQKGNILLEKSNIFILDWETYAKRFKLYDYLLLIYDFRKSHLLKDSIKFFMNDNEYQSLLGLLPKKDLVLLFIIEDIRWQIDESAQLPNESVSNGMNIYLDNNFNLFIQGFINS